jgi:hypothetical protein
VALDRRLLRHTHSATAAARAGGGPHRSPRAERRELRARPPDARARAHRVADHAGRPGGMVRLAGLAGPGVPGLRWTRSRASWSPWHRPQACRGSSPPPRDQAGARLLGRRSRICGIDAAAARQHNQISRHEVTAACSMPRVARSHRGRPGGRSRGGKRPRRTGGPRGLPVGVRPERRRRPVPMPSPAPTAPASSGRR